MTFYTLYNYNFFLNLNWFKYTNYPKDFLTIILIVFTLWIVRTINLLKKNLIIIDFYKFFIKDKYTYYNLIVLIIYLLVRNVL